MTPFEEVDLPEPHRARRKVILAGHSELRALFGHDVRTVWVTLGVVASQLLLAAVFGRAVHDLSWPARIALAAALALAVGAVLSHWLAMTIHETTHNLALPTSAQNIALALFANVPMVLPVAMSFRRYHLTHHAQLGVPGRDTDLPHALEVRFIGRSRPLKALWWLFYAFVYVARSTTFIEAPNRPEWLNTALMFAVNALLFATLGADAMLYLFLSTVFAHGLHPVAAHFIHEHYIFSKGQETYSYYGPLNAVTFNVGYHVEHHDFPNVPGWQLPRLHRLAREHYAPLASHRSWTCLVWKFISDGSLGFGSRIVRKSVHAP